MTRLASLVTAWLVVVAAAAVGGASAVHGTRAQLLVLPAAPHALDPVRVELRARASLPLSRLRIRARSPTGDLAVVHAPIARAGVRRGTFRFSEPGRWTLFVTDTHGRQVPGASARTVRVLDPLPTPAPERFGALGKAGCEPPSPTSGSTSGLRDVFGTAIGRERLWALPFLPAGASWSTSRSAVFDGLVGNEVKIVFAMTSFHRPFRAIGPGGAALTPVWGPSFHGSSSWVRQPGTEWGAGFVFPGAGCWRIAVGSRGEVWLLIRS